MGIDFPSSLNQINKFMQQNEQRYKKFNSTTFTERHCGQPARLPFGGKTGTYTQEPTNQH